MSSNNEEEIESINDENVSESNTANDNESDNVEEQLQKLKSEYLYLRAEFDNFRKNSVKERSQLIRYGAESLIRDLLNVVDNFDRALEMDVNESNVESFKQGMQMTATELKSVLQKFGVKENDPSGEAFDPNLHEALSSEPTDRVPPGHVANVFKKAYLLHDKLIRPAQVVVAREPEAASETTIKNDE